MSLVTIMYPKSRATFNNYIEDPGDMLFMSILREELEKVARGYREEIASHVATDIVPSKQARFDVFDVPMGYTEHTFKLPPIFRSTGCQSVSVHITSSIDKHQELERRMYRTPDGGFCFTVTVNIYAHSGDSSGEYMTVYTDLFRVVKNTTLTEEELDHLVRMNMLEEISDFWCRRYDSPAWGVLATKIVRDALYNIDERAEVIAKETGWRNPCDLYTGTEDK